MIELNCETCLKNPCKEKIILDYNFGHGVTNGVTSVIGCCNHSNISKYKESDESIIPDNGDK